MTRHKLTAAIACLGLGLVSLAQQPTGLLHGNRARRSGGDTDSKSPPHVIPTGNETLAWDLPETLDHKPYRLEMTVRTGNTGGNPLNCVHLYRAWTVDRNGVQSDPIRFSQKPGATPRNVSDVWPHFVGDVVSESPLILEPGMTLNVGAAAAYMEVRRIRMLPAEERDLLSIDLLTNRFRHLFRPGEPMPVTWVVTSFLAVSQDLEAALVLESPYGEVVTRETLRCRVPAGERVSVSTMLRSRQKGPHVASVRCRWRGHELRRELNLDLVGVPDAVALSDESPFGVHPAGLTEMYQAGFKWIRLWDSGDTWNRHERETKGSFDFSRTAAKVNRFREQGMHVLAVLAYTPTWASARPEEGHYTGAGAPYPPTSIQDWKDYCREYMSRFRGRIRHYEVWNEPNAGFFKGSTDEYVHLLKAAFEVARDVDPDIRIVGGSGTGDFLTWTEDILSRGAGHYMDVLSFHAYTTPQSPEEANLGGRIRRLREICARHGVAEIPLWNTEAGYWCDRRAGARPSTEAQILAKAPVATRPNWKSGWPYRPISEADAAAFTLRHYFINAANGVDKLFWYASVTSNFPLLCRDGSLRYPAVAVANAAEVLDGFHFLRRIDLGISRLHLHLWTNGETVIGLLWHADRGTRELVLPAPDSAPSILDIWGNPVHPRVDEDGWHLSAGRDPLMIVASEAILSSARLHTVEISLPIRDCFVVNEVNPDRPVRKHTSPKHHGDREVFGLPDVGDALGWRLKALKPGYYRVYIELRTGSRARPYGALNGYRVDVHRGDITEDLTLIPVEDQALRPVPLTTEEGGNRAYGFAMTAQPVWLEPDNEIHVTLREGFGFVGQLMLREAVRQSRVRTLSTIEETSVALDGTLDEMTGHSPLVLRRRRQVVIGVADPFASTDKGDAWKGPEDLSARLWTAITQKALYVAIEITDPGPLYPSNRGAYNGDCVEVFLDLRTDDQVGNAVMSDQVYQIMLRAPAGVKNQRLEGRIPHGTKAVARTGQQGWTAEFLIPISRPSGAILGLDVAVDDDDSGNGRKSQIVWHGTSQNFQDPSAYGQFRIQR